MQCRILRLADFVQLGMQNHYSRAHGPRPHPKSQPVATATLVFRRELESLSFFAAVLLPGRCWGIRVPLVSHTSPVQAAHLWYYALVPLLLLYGL